jgi:hypothetical protein
MSDVRRFCYVIDKQQFLFLVLRDTDNQIRVSIDEEIKAIVVIDSPLPDIGSLLILLRSDRGVPQVGVKE